MKYIILVLSFLLIAFFLFGCGGSKATTSSGTPAWVSKAGGFYDGDHGKAFYGVGASTGLSNVQLRRTAAETNARADLARMFRTKIEDMVSVYARAVQSGEQSAISEEAFTQQVTRGLTEMELSGTTIVDHYYDVDSKTEFALARLDVDGFKNSLDKMKELNEEVKNQVKFNAEKAFEELDKQINKDK